MNLSHLQVFYEVARCGSFSRAAEALFTAQPALSRQVAALEKELGLALFVRQPRGVVPTEAGRRLLTYAGQIFSLVADAEQAMAAYKNLEAGTLNLAASTTIGNYLLPPLLAAYRQKHPAVEVSLRVANSQEIARLVLNREVDIGLLSGPLAVGGLYVEVFGTDELVAVVAPGHPLAREEEVPLAVLTQETLLLREPGSATRRAVEEYLAGQGIKPGRTFVLENTEAIKGVVASGLGVAFLSRYAVEPEIRYGGLQPLDGAAWRLERQFLLVLPKDARLSPPALAFLAMAKKHSYGAGR